MTDKGFVAIDETEDDHDKCAKKSVYAEHG